jgi:hypothetical protein
MTSVAQLRKILPILLSSLQSVRIVVDGLDEYEDKDHKPILAELLALAKCNKSDGTRKLLISSRDAVRIARVLLRRSNIDLSSERAAIASAIQGFVRSSVSDLHLNLDQEQVHGAAMAAIERTLVLKANGKSHGIVV